MELRDLLAQHVDKDLSTLFALLALLDDCLRDLADLSPEGIVVAILTLLACFFFFGEVPCDFYLCSTLVTLRFKECYN